MTTLYAQPYGISATGFYFQTYEEYLEKSGALLNAYGQKVEEFEIQFIDGDLAELFNACRIDQSTLEIWFNTIESLSHNEQLSLFYMRDNKLRDLEGALGMLDDVSISACSLKDAASELFDECYLSEVPESVKPYIDYEAFARDCELGGDMREFTYAGLSYTCTNANSF